MNTEIIDALDLQVFRAIKMPDGGRIISLCPYATEEFKTGKPWPNVDLANHNVFRLDADDDVIWQVKRVEDEYVNWESRNRHAKEDDPTAEGYFDPFIDMGRLFFERRPLPYKGPFHPKYEDVYFDTFAPGRLLGCRTNWWAYHLDPETGIATCTGAQVK